MVRAFSLAPVKFSNQAKVFILYLTVERGVLFVAKKSIQEYANEASIDGKFNV
jgi:hypothetical protein